MALVKLLSSVSSQTATESYVPLKIGQVFKSEVTGTPPNSWTPAHLLTGGWFKAINVDYQCFLSNGNNAVPLNSPSNTGFGESSSIRYDYNPSNRFCFPTTLGDWIFVVYSFKLLGANPYNAAAPLHVLVMPQNPTTTPTSGPRSCSIWCTTTAPRVTKMRSTNSRWDFCRKGFSIFRCGSISSHLQAPPTRP